MHATIGLQGRFDRESLCGTVAGVHAYEIEVAHSTAIKQATQLCDVRARVVLEIGEQFLTGKSAESWDRGDNGLTRKSSPASSWVVKRRGGAGPHAEL